MSEKLRRLAENKLIILYLVEKMGIPISNSEICQFLLEKNYTDFFNVQQYITELVDAKFLSKSSDSNSIRYTLTDEGTDVLNIFIKHITVSAKDSVNTYVKENGKRIRTEHEVTANYFMELNGEFNVKCGIFDSDGVNLMELSITVPTREQARLMCSNWKSNVNQLYGSIFSMMVDKNEV